MAQEVLLVRQRLGLAKLLGAAIVPRMHKYATVVLE
jgi:hypothetical protein